MVIGLFLFFRGDLQSCGPDGTCGPVEIGPKIRFRASLTVHSADGS